MVCGSWVTGSWFLERDVAVFKCFLGRHIHAVFLWMPMLVALRYGYLWDVVSPVNTLTSSSSFPVFCCSTLGHSSSRAAVCCQTVSELARQSGQAGCLQSFRSVPLKNLLDVFCTECHDDKAFEAFIVQKRWMQNQFRGRVGVLHENHLDLL